MENWKDVPGFEGLYEVSDQGRVRSLDRIIETRSRWGGTKLCRLKGRVLKQATFGASRQHKVVSLGQGNQDFVHRLVLLAFVGPAPEGTECRHLDGDGGNNRLENLTWGTRFENIADRKRLGEENPARGERAGRSTLTEDNVRYIRREMVCGRSYAAIGRDIGATRNAVRNVAIGRCWGWLP